MSERENRLLAVLSWLHTLLLLEGFYFLAAGFMNLEEARGLAYAAGGLWLAVPVVLSFFIIRKVGNLWLYLAVTAVCTVGIYELSRCLLTGVLTGVVFLIRSYVRIKKGQIRRLMEELPGRAGAQADPQLWEIPTLLDRPRSFHWTVFLLCYGGILMNGHYEYLRPVLLLLAGEIMVCFVFGYVERVRDFAKINQGIANVPVKTMKKVGRGIFVLLAAGLMLFMLPGVLWGEEPLTELHFEYQGGPSEDFSLEVSERLSMDEMMEALGSREGYQEAPVWVRAAANLLLWALGIAIACFVLRILVRALKNTMRSFAREEGDEVIALDEDEISGVEPGALGGRKARSGWLSPDMRIRRKYKRTILRSLGERPAGTETPQELEEKAQIKGDERFHILYEKARYSQEGCSREEAKEYPV